MPRTVRAIDRVVESAGASVAIATVEQRAAEQIQVHTALTRPRAMPILHPPGCDFEMTRFNLEE